MNLTLWCPSKIRVFSPSTIDLRYRSGLLRQCAVLYFGRDLVIRMLRTDCDQMRFDAAYPVAFNGIPSLTAVQTFADPSVTIHSRGIPDSIADFVTSITAAELPLGWEPARS
jgi:hypothetical protein